MAKTYLHFDPLSEDGLKALLYYNAMLKRDTMREQKEKEFKQKVEAEKKARLEKL